MAEVACGRRSFRLSAVVAAAVAVLTIAAPVPVADAATGDAIANPSFETSTSGWNTNGSFSSNGSPAGVTLTRVEGGHSGAWAASLVNGGAASANCLLNDSPNWVATTATGTYTASLWVRAGTPGATGVRLKLQEFRKDNGVLVGAASSTIVLTTAWQQVSVAYTPLAPGVSTLDYNAYGGAAPGTCFDADDAGLAFDPAPAASLTVTPATGVAPLTVHADASGSATPVESYSFNFQDGPVVGPQAAATADHTYVAGGTYTVTVTVAHTGGPSSIATAQVVVTAGIITNPSFEPATPPGGAGWNTSGSGAGVTLTQVGAGLQHSGGHAAQLSNGGTAAVNYCILNDSPNWVATTATGTYTASLWVRADTPGATLKLKLREYSRDSGAFVGEAKSAIVLTTAWQQVSVAYTPLAPGASTLDYTAYVANAAPGTCFYADDAAIAYQT